MPRKKKKRSNPPKKYNSAQATNKAHIEQAKGLALVNEIVQGISNPADKACETIEDNAQEVIDYYEEWLIRYRQLNNKDKSLVTSLFPYIFFVLGQTYASRDKKGDLDKAIELFSKSYEDCPFNLENKFYLGVAQMKKQKYNVAITIFYEIINHTPNEKLKYEKIEYSKLPIDLITAESIVYYSEICLNITLPIKLIHRISIPHLEQLLIQAAKQSYKALYYLSIIAMYHKKEMKESVKYMQKFLDQGNELNISTKERLLFVDAHCQLGVIAVEDGDFDKAIAHFTIGINYQYAYAQYNLAIALDHYNNPKRDPIAAIKYYLDAANQGCLLAYNNLGFKYLTPEDVEFNLELGLKYTKLAAENGVKEAMNRLGRAYCEGDFMAQDLNEAIKWYNKAIDHGSTDAYCGLATTYMRKAAQLETKKGDIKKVATYNKTALKHLLKLEGNANNQSVYAILGTLYSGISVGTPIDYNKATTYLINSYLIDSHLKGNEALAHNIFCLYNNIKTADTVKYSSLLTKIEAFFEQQFNEKNVVSGYYHTIITLQNNSLLHNEAQEAEKKAKTLHIQTNKLIQYAASNKNEAAIEKLKKIISLAKGGIFDPTNYSTLIYFVGLIFVNVGTSRPKLYSFWSEISAIINDAAKKLVNLDKNNLRKSIIGLSHLYRHVKDNSFYESLNDFYKNVINHHVKLDTQDICKILLASTRFDLTDHNMKNNLENLSRIVLQREETLKANDVANLIYSMAVFDCHYRKNKKAYSISINNIKPIITLAISWSNGNNLDKAAQHQIYLGLLYFYTKYHEVKSEIKMLKGTMENLHLLINKEEKDSNISRLQKRVADSLKRDHPDLVEEKPINGLPVDIYIPSLNLIIQVDGPTHFLEYEGNYSIAAKTLFHDTILGLPSPGSTSNIHKKPHILHLPYFELNLISLIKLAQYLQKKINELNITPEVKVASTLFSSPQKLPQDTAMADPIYIAPFCQ